MMTKEIDALGYNGGLQYKLMDDAIPLMTSKQSDSVMAKIRDGFLEVIGLHSGVYFTKY